MAKKGTKIQYALVKKGSGESATLTHQDDLESPLVGDTLSELFSAMGDWSDMGTTTTLRHMKKGGEFEDYEIIKQEINIVPLTDEDRKVIDDATKGVGEDADEEEDES